MTLYYFDLNECGEVLPDDEGQDLPDDGAAREIAILSARSVMSAEVERGRLCLGCCIIVRNVDRKIVLRVPFRDAIHITGLDPDRS